MKFVLLHPASYDTSAIANALVAESVQVKPIDSPEQVRAEGLPTVLLIDPPSRTAYHPDSLKRFVDAGGAVVLLGAPASHRSLGPLVGVRIEPRRLRVGPGLFVVEHHLLKNKQGLALEGTAEHRRGPWGLR